MKQYAKSEQRQVVAQRHRVPIQLDVVYTLAVRSWHTDVCHVVMVITNGEPARSATQVIQLNVEPTVYISASQQGYGREVGIWYEATDPDGDFVGGTLTAQAEGGVVHQLGTTTAGYQSVTITIPDEWGKTDYTITLHADYTTHGQLTAQTTVTVAPPSSNML